MSIRTTYTCDRCNHSQPTNEQIWNVAVSVWHDGHSEPKLYELHPKSEMWCRKCVEELGILQPYKLPAPHVPETEPSLEDQIREIVRDELQAAGQ